MKFVTKSDKLSAAFSCVTLVVIFIFPFFVWVLLWRKFSVLNTDLSKISFGSTYAEIRTDNKSALLYNVIYMLRRLVIALIATLCKD